MSTAADRLRSGVLCIRSAAWDSAAQYVAFILEHGKDDYGIARESRAFAAANLAALFYLLATPNEEQQSVDELIGAVAWVMGGASLIAALAHRQVGAYEFAVAA